MGNNRIRISNLFILTGPSAVGKTTLVKRLLSHFPEKVAFVPSYTTRGRRHGEIPGEDMNFLTEEEFANSFGKKEFLAFNTIYGHHYGTKKKEVYDALEAGKRVILILDEKGADDVRDSGLGAVYVYLAPTSLDLLKERLTKRRTPKAEMSSRLESAQRELEARWKYTHLLLSGTNNKDFVFDQMSEIMGLK